MAEPDTTALRALADAHAPLIAHVYLDPATVRALCDGYDEAQRLRGEHAEAFAEAMNAHADFLRAHRERAAARQGAAGARRPRTNHRRTPHRDPRPARPGDVMTGLDEFAASTTWNPAPARYGRTWEIRLPWTKPPASANDRDHWRVKAKKVADIRAVAAYEVAMKRPVQRAMPARIVVGLTYVPRDRRRRDPDNLVVPLMKALVDGIVDAGIVPDDTPQYVLRTMPVIAEPDGDPRLVLTIREVLDA